MSSDLRLVAAPLSRKKFPSAARASGFSSLSTSSRCTEELFADNGRAEELSISPPSPSVMST